MSPLRMLTGVLLGLLLVQPKLREQDRQATDVGETIGRYVLDRAEKSDRQQRVMLLLTAISAVAAVVAAVAAILVLLA
jgi:hypothetical protein